MVSPAKMSGWGKWSDRKPHFFKVLLGDFKHRLKIPPKFMKHIAKESSPSITLQDPKGSSWRVKLSKTITGYFLSDGWSNFVKDHFLKEHEFLVFRYVGNMHFDVMIFDTSACEREDVFEMKIPDVSARKGKYKRGHRVLHSNYNLQHQFIKREKLKLLSEKQDASKRLHGVWRTSAIREQSACRRRLGFHAFRGQEKSPDITKNRRIKINDVELPINKTQPQNVYFSRRIKERSKAEVAARSFYSSFPCAIVHITRSIVYKTSMVRLPIRFSRMYLPHVKTSMVLLDPNGKAWNVNYIPCSEQQELSEIPVKKEQAYFSGGWPAFVRGNNLKEGDFCAFELTSENEVKVHIFREVETTASEL